MDNIKSNQKACGYRLAIMELLNKETNLESYALFDTLRVLYSEYEKVANCNTRQDGVRRLKDIEDIILKIEPSVLSHKSLDVAKEALMKIDRLPEVFPLASNGVRFEYNKPSGDCLKFEIYEDRNVCAILDNGLEKDYFTLDIDGINEEVNKFFDQQ